MENYMPSTFLIVLILAYLVYTAGYVRGKKKQGKVNKTLLIISALYLCYSAWFLWAAWQFMRSL